MVPNFQHFSSASALTVLANMTQPQGNLAKVKYKKKDFISTKVNYFQLQHPVDKYLQFSR
jgi:hypothetical protein